MKKTPRILVIDDDPNTVRLLQKWCVNAGKDVIGALNGKDGILKLSTVLGEEISDKASELTVIPYAVDYPEQSGKLNNYYKQVGEKFTIKIK